MAANDGNKTLPPTEKKLQDARKEGNYLFSMDITQAVTLWTMIGLLVVIAYTIPKNFADGLTLVMRYISEPNPDLRTGTQDLLLVIGKTIMGSGAVLFLGYIIASIISGVSQVGFVFDSVKIRKALSFEQGMNVAVNAQNLFSKRSLMTFLFSLAKTAMILGIVYYTIRYDKTLVRDIYSCRNDIWCVLEVGGQRVWYIFLYIAIMLIPMAALDWSVQRAIYMKENMMSHDEMAKEHKEIEGDPDVKNARKNLAHEIVTGEFGRIGHASAIIRNPTHVAIAVRYEPGTMALPYVIAKGVDEVALKIIAEAEKHGIPSYIDVPLARAMINDCELNTFVPLTYMDQMIKFSAWLSLEHPERVYQITEIAQMGGVGNVKRSTI